MMRRVWFFFVPGHRYAWLYWLFIAAIEACFDWWRPSAVASIIIAALNAYSWDYQRRHRGAP
jgi:apolipoprotein N-acyltransferase